MTGVLVTESGHLRVLSRYTNSMVYSENDIRRNISSFFDVVRTLSKSRKSQTTSAQTVA